MEVTGHGVGGYRSGCRCAVCRNAETQRKRDYRARGGGKVVAMRNGKEPVRAEAKTTAKPKIVGSVEQAVLDEVAPLPAASERPGMVACALERYRLERSEYPPALEDLQRRGYVDSLPRDLITGDRLQYRRLNASLFVLYSVGGNQQDDGGSTRAEADWVWKYPAGEAGR